MDDLKKPMATAADVAQMAGVSQSAVSRAFTPGASVASATRRRILEAAAALGYQPNLIARTLTSGRSNIVGVGVGNLANPFFACTLDELSIQLAEAGLRLLLFTTNDGGQLETHIQEVLQYKLDALVMLSTALSSPLAKQCKLANIPVVMYNRIATTSPDISSVTGNNFGGARALASFLLAGGHRRPAFIAGMGSSSTSRQREEGFTAALVEAGLGPPLREEGNFSHSGAMTAMRRLLSRPDRPDAVFCANDYMAIAAIEVAQAEFGLAVGQEISIVGFDDIPMASWPSFSLTTYSQSVTDMVDATVQTIQALRSGCNTPIHKVIDGGLVIRGSARRPRRPGPSLL